MNLSYKNVQIANNGFFIDERSARIAGVINWSGNRLPEKHA